MTSFSPEVVRTFLNVQVTVCPAVRVTLTLLPVMVGFPAVQVMSSRSQLAGRSVSSTA